MRPVDEPRDFFTHLILNPAAGNTTALLASLTRAARECGIGLRVLDTGRTRGTQPSRQRMTAQRRSLWPAATGRWQR